MNRAATAQKIAPFIRDYKMNEEEFLEPADSFPHFNAFFYRKLKSSARPIAASAAVFPADGRHLVFPKISEIENFFVKGQKFQLREFLQDDALFEHFEDGSLLLSRLCPVDYHRFHFPASGTPEEPRLINGPLFSVSPIALRKNLSYLWQNKRTVTILDSEKLGKLAIVEVGATCVGSIHQSYSPQEKVNKGDEKGYFSFGGSSTITLFEPGAITFAEDLLENSSIQREVYALMGDQLSDS
jgi:phosphatidylserine decarboxylase